jgi:hypothetical protein
LLPAALSFRPDREKMMIEIVAIALVVSTVVALAVDGSIPVRKWLDLRRSNEPDGSRTVATHSALEAERKRLADLKAELAAAETRTAERERQISVELRKLTAAQRERTEAAGELAKREAALAQRERILERSLADAERSAAEATARIEAREAALATQEPGLQQQESELADRHRHPSAVERDSALEEGLSTAESDWWEKQLGPPLSAKK